MNQTEAYELVLKAAQNFLQIDETESTLTGHRMMPRLQAAINKVEPRVNRMRSKLDFLRSTRAGKPNLPSWMAP